MEQDFLDAMIAKRAERNAEIPGLVDAALERRRQQRKQQAMRVVAPRVVSRHATRTSTPPSTASLQHAGTQDELATV